MRAGTRIAEETLDELADDLMRLRERTGATSYAEIARRITVRRVADGELPDGAMIPRSTVYHAFSKGRTRIDAELVRDIALALGESAERADDWVRRCGSARKRAPELRVPEAVDTAPVALAAIPAEHGGGAARRAAPPAATLAPVVGRIEPSTGPVPVATLTAASHSALARWAHPARGQAGLTPAPAAAIPRPEAVATLTPLPDPPRIEPPASAGQAAAAPALRATVHRRRSPAQRAWFTAVVLLGCLALNLGGQAVVELLHLPVYLDMIGTAVAALAFGPAAGVLVGVATNGIGIGISGALSVPFALVNMAGALVWALGVQRFRGGDTFLRFFSLNMAVAVVCAIVATPILIWGFGGATGHGSEYVLRFLAQGAAPEAGGVFVTTLLASITDKLLTGFVALAILVPLTRRGGADVRHLPVVDRLTADS